MFRRGDSEAVAFSGIRWAIFRLRVACRAEAEKKWRPAYIATEGFILSMLDGWSNTSVRAWQWPCFSLVVVICAFEKVIRELSIYRAEVRLCTGIISSSSVWGGHDDPAHDTRIR